MILQISQFYNVLHTMVPAGGGGGGSGGGGGGGGSTARVEPAPRRASPVTRPSAPAKASPVRAQQPTPRTLHRDSCCFVWDRVGVVRLLFLKLSPHRRHHPVQTTAVVGRIVQVRRIATRRHRRQRQTFGRLHPSATCRPPRPTRHSVTPAVVPRSAVEAPAPSVGAATRARRGVVVEEFSMGTRQ